jgi:dephospho-CoA kinase
VIGIVGPIGAGKSAVAELFASWAGTDTVISGDAIGYHVIADSVTVRRRLARAFGRDILTGDTIDRPLLAARAFAGPEPTARLNAIVHPPLLRELRRQIRRERLRRDAEAVILDAALLLEWGGDAVAWDCLVGVWAPQSVRLARTRRRGWSDTEARRRARQQLPWTEKRRHCICVVKNDSSRPILRRRARFCWEKALSYCTTSAS